MQHYSALASKLASSSSSFFAPPPHRLPLHHRTPRVLPVLRPARLLPASRSAGGNSGAVTDDSNNNNRAYNTKDRKRKEKEEEEEEEEGGSEAEDDDEEEGEDDKNGFFSAASAGRWRSAGLKQVRKVLLSERRRLEQQRTANFTAFSNALRTLVAGEVDFVRDVCGAGRAAAGGADASDEHLPPACGGDDGDFDADADNNGLGAAPSSSTKKY
jgi:hypothetical protein